MTTEARTTPSSFVELVAKSESVLFTHDMVKDITAHRMEELNFARMKENGSPYTSFSQEAMAAEDEFVAISWRVARQIIQDVLLVSERYPSRRHELVRILYTSKSYEEIRLRTIAEREWGTRSDSWALSSAKKAMELTEDAARSVYEADCNAAEEAKHSGLRVRVSRKITRPEHKECW